MRMSIAAAGAEMTSASRLQSSTTEVGSDSRQVSTARMFYKVNSDEFILVVNLLTL